MSGILELILLASSLGLLIGWYVHHNQKKGHQANTAKLPIMGPMLAYEYWWPKTAHDKDIIIGKLMVVYYMLLAAFVTSYFYLFLIVPVLFHFEWFNPKNDKL